MNSKYEREALLPRGSTFNSDLSPADSGVNKAKKKKMSSPAVEQLEITELMFCS